MSKKSNWSEAALFLKFGFAEDLFLLKLGETDPGFGGLKRGVKKPATNWNRFKRETRSISFVSLQARIIY